MGPTNMIAIKKVKMEPAKNPSIDLIFFLDQKGGFILCLPNFFPINAAVASEKQAMRIETIEIEKGINPLSARKKLTITPKIK